MTLSVAALSRRKLRAAARRAPLLACTLALMGLAQTAEADKIANPTAVFDGLDKITGRIISFEVAINETVQFGTLQITPRVCYSRPPTEQPQTDVFAQVDEIDEKKEMKRIFSGWMFADKATGAPFETPGAYGARLAELCQEEGLIIRAIGDVIAFCPPLIVTEAEIDALFDRFGRALARM